ncbi:DUF4105 domain-containing protein [Niveibacterium sp. 24ML]|uniref:Lnb N-terminal periplasmic domain-containing protein n=1 Tax=Niveibacterium sp. 24ML TaxID=2985512 RepID=UPI00226F69B0|nr:DUF4105 domain-containing protein [Niveibacterium sp. 24ML]MCX9156265.1 DUF4105 domain-containing protein [Niveibacterium sp. 24ML]
MRVFLRVLLGFAAFLLSLWALAAIWVDGPASRALAGSLCGAYLAGLALIMWKIKPFRRAALLGIAAWGLVAIWWLTIPASNDRAWLTDVSQLPTATIEGDTLVIKNLRNFEYRSSDADFVPHWETRRYDLSKLEGLDLAISFWGPTQYGHTILSWQFKDQAPLAISIETRKEKGEEYSAVLGFFRQFELYYVVADERDVLGVRTNYRKEQIRLYRLNTSPESARKLLEGYVESFNALARKPDWYNALTTNCTTAIFKNVKHVFGISRLFDWRIIANGHLDEMAYEERVVNTTMPLAELRTRSDITQRAKQAGSAADFSTRIRAELPPRPAD